MWPSAPSARKWLTTSIPAPPERGGYGAAMGKLDDYLDAATRENTERSYAAAIRHYEVEWKGFLPATADAVARYLSHYAGELSNNTLRQRLAGLARWHNDQGFPDPTKAPLVRKVLKGIKTVHGSVERQAVPLQMQQLEQVVAWLDRAIQTAEASDDRTARYRHTRDKALLLLGFWRGFRGDELVQLCIEHVDAVAGQGMQCYLPISKGDRQLQGRRFKVPALPRLCPVTAFLAWMELAPLAVGPVFRAVNKWGHVSEERLHINSLVPLLRRLFTQAGLPSPDRFSGHSLRRGFATWASGNGWDVKTLMEYVGWRDMHSALRYIDSADPFAQLDLQPTAAVAAPALPAAPRSLPLVTTTLMLEVQLRLTRFNAQVRGLSKAHRLIESLCLAPHHMQRRDKTGHRYRITLELSAAADVDDSVAELLDRMQHIAGNHQCFLEVTVHDPASGRQWD